MDAALTMTCGLCGWPFNEPTAHARFCAAAEHMECAHHFPVPEAIKPLMADPAKWERAMAEQARRAGRAQWN